MRYKVYRVKFGTTYGASNVLCEDGVERDTEFRYDYDVFEHVGIPSICRIGRKKVWGITADAGDGGYKFVPVDKKYFAKPGEFAPYALE